MLNSPLISDLIFKGEVHEIKAIMAKSRELGMQTFDQHLFELYESGQISYEDALRNADSVNELRLMIKLAGPGGEGEGRDVGHRAPQHRLIATLRARSGCAGSNGRNILVVVQPARHRQGAGPSGALCAYMTLLFRARHRGRRGGAACVHPRLPRPRYVPCCAWLPPAFGG